MARSYLNVNEPTLEHMSPRSKVVRQVAVGIGSRIMDGLLSGTLNQARKLGYDYKSDKDIPENFDFIDMRSADITEKLEFQKYFTAKIKEKQREITELQIQEKAASAAPESPSEPSNNEKATDIPKVANDT
jgi:hypothetical protein